MNARRYWKQDQGEIPDDKISNLPTINTVFSINVDKNKMDSKPIYSI